METSMSEQSKRILLIEDEPGLVMTLTDRLEKEGYSVRHYGDGLQGKEAALLEMHDLILLDVMLPGEGGFEVCRDLRTQGITTPILILTARGQLNEKIVGLKLGADDYMTKPFEMLELLARIESLMRRPRSMVSPSDSMLTYAFGPVNVNFRKRIVYRGGNPVTMSGREFQLLAYLIENRGRAQSREAILSAVWGFDTPQKTRTIDTHITWLRQKLEENPKHPRFLVTVHGVGYKFVG